MKTIGEYIWVRPEQVFVYLLIWICMWRPASWRWRAAPSTTTWAAWQSWRSLAFCTVRHRPKTGGILPMNTVRYWLVWYGTVWYLRYDNTSNQHFTYLTTIFFKGFVNQDYGSADPPKEIVTDPQHRSRFRSWNKYLNPDSNMIEKGGMFNKNKC
jgi:hypothetical protein